MKKSNIRIPFLTAIVVGLLTHFLVLVNNYPNADAMTNFYFDQNMVTSGRWFLTIACGISSYFDLKWVNGILSILYLAAGSVILVSLFELKDKISMGLVAALLVTFPAVTATFSYMYTADGYFLALSLTFLAVLVTKRFPKFGWAVGAVLFSLGMGTYQAYSAAAVLLCMFDIILMCMHNKPVKETLGRMVRYLGMGGLGGVLYYVILKICLAAQGKVLDTYQGISSMTKFTPASLPERIIGAYRDFAGFAGKGKIFLLNGFSYLAMVLLCGAVLASVVIIVLHTGALKKWYQSLLVLLFILLLPLGTNAILLFSSEAYYHLLMRMQWVLFPVFAVVIVAKAFETGALKKLVSGEKKDSGKSGQKEGFLKKYADRTVLIIGIIGAGFFIWQFILADNIAYFNMQERYEKTYAYCIRIADRIEQTPGYYQGMPVMMIGVVDENKYPVTDVTADVTERISGTTGDILIYKGEQYKAFMEHYLNVSINVIDDPEKIIEIYNSDTYREMGSFPDADSIKIVDGILYVKTEIPEEK